MSDPQQYTYDYENCTQGTQKKTCKNKRLKKLSCGISEQGSYVSVNDNKDSTIHTLTTDKRWLFGCQCMFSHGWKVYMAIK